ncbi:lipopolysaccharide transport periplasmic protein LptA [Albidovulum sediminicola]|uniref:Lipopolysaccharide transport periplasmic protein LptA n=1 Tax=Albidovulum sediminicola TaxID=2984331 RepID=A0ABT2YWZ2_9RHOB|nr:lipopolysaccharide transport periplasmic protein LptA [Defluviimonas sp. WL0075]MCV2863345.1 lipopolysaccharide transport periplasmic protein LptA [Defluviimonas sp. WL0075]
MSVRAFITALCLTLAPTGVAVAQGAEIAFGGIRADTDLPVEVTADRLAVNQTDGTAVFSGNVVVTQGEMHLGADEIRVEYAAGGQNRIERLIATGNVVLTSGPDAAKSDRAEYTVDSGEILMAGSVLLTQGATVISGETLALNLAAGTGQMGGRVKTVLQPGGN